MNFIKQLKTISFALLVISILLIIGCGGNKKTGPGSRKESDFSEQEKYGGIFRIAQTSDPSTFDPSAMWDVTSHGTLSAVLYNGLVRFDMEGNIIPDLAEKWDISSDGKTYTFYLRQNVKFHNGESLTAKDVEFSYKRFLVEPKAHYKWALEKVEGSKAYVEQVENFMKKQKTSLRLMDIINRFKLTGLQVKDDFTIVINLNQSYTPFINGLAMPALYITHEKTVKKFGEDFGQNPIGTGPFKLKEWVQNAKVVFEYNPDYYDGRPYLDAIEVSIIKDETNIYRTFQSGDLEAMLIPDASFKRIVNDPQNKSNIVSRPELSIHALSLGLERPYLNNKKVRLAMNHAINRQQLLETIFNGRGTLATGPVPIGLPGYVSTSKGIEYNPEKAKQLLKEAGYPKNLKLKIWITESKTGLDVAQAIQADLAKVGIETEITQSEWHTRQQAVLQGATDLTYPWVWSADYADAENFLYPVYHSRNIPTDGNSARYRNPEVDKILDQAHTEQDPMKVKELLHSAEELIMKDAPKVYLWYPTSYAMHQPWVYNYQIPAIYNADKMNKIFMDQKR